MLLAFHKPYGVLSQFTPDGSTHASLAGFGLPKGVYPMGRLDADSEGLLFLTDEPGLNSILLDPRHGHERTYWVQVERIPTDPALDTLRRGVLIQGYRTRPCDARRIAPPADLPPRDPPIRIRKSVPDAWIEMTLVEGKNRQVRRMTAAVGHPTLRLIRVGVGRFRLDGLRPGEHRRVLASERERLFARGLIHPSGMSPQRGSETGWV